VQLKADKTRVTELPGRQTILHINNFVGNICHSGLYSLYVCMLRHVQHWRKTRFWFDLVP